jgi:hypothetical protein
MDPETIRLLAEMMSAQQGEASTTGSGQPFSSMLEGGMDMLRSIKAAKEKGPRPVYSTALKAPFLVRYEYIAGYNHAKKEQLEHERSSKNESNSAAIMMRQTMKPLIEHGAAPTLKSLTPISLRQVARLGVNKIHADRVLFCTTSYAPHRAVGTQVLVEDDDMDCLTLSLYNYVQDDEDPNQVLPVGTHLAVLAPYMKNARDDRQMILMLRCDNPQCIIKYDSKAAWLADREGKPPPPETSDALSLKERGNQAFRNKDFKAAERFYSRALQSSSIQESDKIACWSNRSEAALRSGQWEDAEQTASGLRLETRCSFAAHVLLSRVKSSQFPIPVLTIRTRIESKSSGIGLTPKLILNVSAYRVTRCVPIPSCERWKLELKLRTLKPPKMCRLKM